MYSLSNAYWYVGLKIICIIGLEYLFFLQFYLYFKIYNCTVSFSYITQKLHLVFDAKDVDIYVSLQYTGYTPVF